MKYTRKFLDGYITYDENDAIVNADSFFGFIFKSIAALIYGTILGLFYTAVRGLLAYVGFGALVWLLCLIA